MQKKSQKNKRGALFQKAVNRIRQAVGGSIRKLADIISPQEANPDIIQTEQEVSQSSAALASDGRSNSRGITLTEESVIIQPEQKDIETIRKEALERKKESAQHIIELANERWRDIEEHDFASFAIERAMQESRGIKYFSLEDIETESELNDELTRARVFIEDYTSSLNGAENLTNELRYMQYHSKFGNQWKSEENPEAYDTETLSTTFAKTAFALYRRLEETRGIQIQSFGSDKVIAMIYDIVEDNGTLGTEEQDMEGLIKLAQDRLDKVLGETFDISYYRWSKENERIESMFDSTGLESNF